MREEVEVNYNEETKELLVEGTCLRSYSVSISLEDIEGIDEKMINDITKKIEDWMGGYPIEECDTLKTNVEDDLYSLLN